MNYLVRDLHKMAIPTKIIEVGCGVALSNLLFSENHASNTVYDVYSPYNRDAQLKLAPELANDRAVSLKNTDILLKTMFDGERKFAYYVANFQIGGDPDKKKTTHGYIGVAGSDQIPKYYHITIPGEGERSYLLRAIANVGLAILFNKMIDITGGRDYDVDYIKQSIPYVDQVFNQDFQQDLDETLNLFLDRDLTETNESDDLLCYQGGKFHRFEDFFRDKKKVLIYRGTFNPITNAHLEIFNEASKQEQPDFACLMIAHSIYNKPGLTTSEIKQRMLYADALNLPLLIGNSYRYLDMIKHFRQRQFLLTETNLLFLMGVDTIDRIFDSESNEFYTDSNLNNITYLYGNRKNYSLTKDKLDFIRLINRFLDHIQGEKNQPMKPLRIKKLENFEDEQGISATQVRKFLKEANLTEIAKIIPESILKTIIQNQIK